MGWFRKLFGDTTKDLERSVKDVRKDLERRVKLQRKQAAGMLNDALADALEGLTPVAQDALLQLVLKRLPDLIADARKIADKVQ